MTLIIPAKRSSGGVAPSGVNVSLWIASKTHVNAFASSQLSLSAMLRISSLEGSVICSVRRRYAVATLIQSIERVMVRTYRDRHW
jgi:hypothetical protein